MRYIKIPEDVMIMEDEVNEIPAKDSKGVPLVVNFVEWLVNNVTKDKAFGVDMDKLESRIRIKNAVLRLPMETKGPPATRRAAPGDVISLESGDWQVLNGVVSKPSDGFMPAGASQCISFLRAIRDAKEEPEKV